MNILDDMVNPVQDGSAHAPTPCHGRNAYMWGPHTHENAAHTPPPPPGGKRDTQPLHRRRNATDSRERGAHLRATWTALVRPSRHRDRKGTV